MVRPMNAAVASILAAIAAAFITYAVMEHRAENAPTPTPSVVCTVPWDHPRWDVECGPDGENFTG